MLQSSAFGVALDQKWVVGPAEPAAVLSGRLASRRSWVIGQPRQRHRRRQTRRTAANFRQQRPHAGRVLAAGWVGVAVQHRRPMSRQRRVPAGEVSRVAVRQRANDGRAVHARRHLRKVFANVQARVARCDRLEFAADFIRGVGLHVERFELARSAPHEKKNATLRGLEACVRRMRLRPAKDRAGPNPRRRSHRPATTPGD